MKEIWKDIKGYEGLYQVSTLGRIKRITFINNMINKPQDKLLSLKKIDNLGYKTVCLCKNNQLKNKRIHRLVAETFLPNSKNLPCVNHIDGNKQNNYVSNLEWCTHSYNTKHALKSNLINTEKHKKAAQNNIKIAQKYAYKHSGENNGRAKLSKEDIITIRESYSQKLMNQNELSIKYNVSQSTIGSIINRKTWKNI